MCQVDWVLANDILGSVKDILGSFAIILGAYVALCGLDAWRRELIGKNQYEVV